MSDAGGHINISAPDKSICISLVVAMANNGVIGRDNQLPWHLPEDLKYFKSITLGKPIVMGRKTFESIGRPLPGRRNIVITRNQQWQHEGVEVVQSLDEAIHKAAEGDDCNATEVMVIGGEQIYRLALPLAQRLYITRVDASVQGDAFFPAFDAQGWHELSRRQPETVDKLPYYFQILERGS